LHIPEPLSTTRACTSPSDIFVERRGGKGGGSNTLDCEAARPSSCDWPTRTLSHSWRARGACQQQHIYSSTYVLLPYTITLRLVRTIYGALLFALPTFLSYPFKPRKLFVIHSYHVLHVPPFIVLLLQYFFREFVAANLFFLCLRQFVFVFVRSFWVACCPFRLVRVLPVLLLLAVSVCVCVFLLVGVGVGTLGTRAADKKSGRLSEEWQCPCFFLRPSSLPLVGAASVLWVLLFLLLYPRPSSSFPLSAFHWWKGPLCPRIRSALPAQGRWGWPQARSSGAASGRKGHAFN